MLILCIAFLAGLYVLKIFFPQEFMMSIQNKHIIKIGDFIDNHAWLYYICCGLTAYTTYYLYCCACSGRIKLKWYEFVEILIVVVAIRAISFYDDNIATGIETCSFWFLPLLMKGKIKNTALTFTIQGMSQVLSLSIRNLPMYLHSVNFVTMFCFGIESYLWLILLKVIFSYKKEKGE